MFIKNIYTNKVCFLNAFFKAIMLIFQIQIIKNMKPNTAK